MEEKDRKQVSKGREQASEDRKQAQVNRRQAQDHPAQDVIGGSQKEEDSRLQLEDKILKTAAQFFGDALLPLVGIHGKIRYVAPTEQIHLEARKMEEDFNFVMEDGTLRHLEFESDSIGIEDLRRFREYEAYMSMVYKMPVITSVLCTSEVKNLKDSLTEGINHYRVHVIRLKDQNADEILIQLETRSNRGEPVTRREWMQLLLVPLMSGHLIVKERIFKGLRLIQADNHELDQEERRRMESVLYTLAIKFLDKKDLKQVKERFGMTLLGQMLMEDGIKKGEMIKLISMVLRKVKKGQSAQTIAEILEENPDLVERICKVIQANPEAGIDRIYELLS